MREHIHVAVSMERGARTTAFFINDVCAMLAAIASRSGDSLDAFQLGSVSAEGPEERFSVLHSPPSLRLKREAGLHRAQFVLIGSVTGRIETALVRVEFVGTNDDRSNTGSASEIVRTYNYPLRRSTHHASGRTAQLDDVLTGLVE
jgi:protein subunit release factor A